MLEKLKTKWKANTLQVILILCTFALGGSLTGYVGKGLLSLLPVAGTAWQVPVYIIVVTLLWPVMVLGVSVFFGQYAFFKMYLKKMGSRMGILKKPKN